MQSKVERFKQWRGEKAATAEKQTLSTALLIDDYINKEVDGLATIKKDFISNLTPQYKKLDKFKRRSLGILLYCKLALDESVDKVPVNSQNPIASTERQLLSSLSTLLTDVYVDYTKNPTTRVFSLIATTNRLLELDTAQLHNLQQAKRLSYSLYFMLVNIHLILSNLSGFKKILVQRVIDVEKIQIEVTSLLQKAETKVHQIEQLIPSPTLELVKKSKFSQAIQDAFNNRYYKLLCLKQNDSNKFLIVNDVMTAVTSDLEKLVNARNEHVEITRKILMIKRLLEIAQANELKISGRYYFIDLIENNPEEFKVLLNTIPRFKRIKFDERIKQIKSPDLYRNLSSTALSGLSWITALPVIGYRRFTPQLLQDKVSSTFVTLDSDCKAELIACTESSLTALNKQLKTKENEIIQFTAQLANGSEEVKNLIANESTPSLNALIKPNDEAKGAINKYWQLSMQLNDKANQLQTINEAQPVLNQYIKTHDGFLVKLSNLFSLIFPIFKSETATMIDNARHMKSQLKTFEQNYYKEMKNMMGDMEHDQNLSPEIKVQLKQLVKTDSLPIKQQPLTRPVGQDELHTLITNLNHMFHPLSAKNISPYKPSSNSFSR